MKLSHDEIDCENCSVVNELNQENADLKKRLSEANDMNKRRVIGPEDERYLKGRISELVEMVDFLKEENSDLKKRVEELEQWVGDLQSGKYINCVYCGHRYPPGTPGVMSKILYEHIKKCPKHPLAKAEADLACLIEAVEEHRKEIITARFFHSQDAELYAVLDSLKPKEEGK